MILTHSHGHIFDALTIQVYSSREILRPYILPNYIFLNSNFFIFFYPTTTTAQRLKQKLKYLHQLLTGLRFVKTKIILFPPAFCIFYLVPLQKCTFICQSRILDLPLSSSLLQFNLIYLAVVAFYFLNALFPSAHFLSNSSSPGLLF